VTRDVVLVTGAAHGVGAAIAAALHRDGFRVGIGDIDFAGAEALARRLNDDDSDDGPDDDPDESTIAGASTDYTETNVIPIGLDVRDAGSIESARNALLARWGSVEALVNNAAVTAAKPVLDITPEEFDAVFAVNVRGTFVASQVFAREFKTRGYGRIVNLASLAGQNGGTATGAHYAASKGAILTLTKVFARDLAAFGITVNALAPGPLDTPMVHRTVPADRMAQLIAGIPTGALGDPAFVARMAARLCARDAGFVTGATWDINGGLFMR
jgi:3-oxoacyl-[acyl-carrier protein] reductase